MKAGPAEGDLAREHAMAFLERERKRAKRHARAAVRARTALVRAMLALGPRFGVRRALLFGSLAWGGFDADRSDVDLLVWGLDTGSQIDLAAELSARIRREVHLVVAETAPDRLRERVEREGEPLDVA